MKLTEAIEVHEELNPKIWNSDMTLKEDVKEKLNEIQQEFLDNIDIPLNVVDVEIVGSNASYNYNESSDLDLHIIVNSEFTYMEPELLQQFYNSKKNSFNNNYDIDINGIPVELYIEDIKSSNATMGRYSLYEDNWIKIPEPITYEIPDISDELNNYTEMCLDVLETNNPQDILDLINNIYMMRKLGLEIDGEASTGNLVFKELRSNNIIEDLRDKYYELKSKELSL